MKKRLSTLLLVLVLLIGSGLIIYPTASDYWNSLHESKAIVKYIKSVSDMSDERRGKMLKDAADYNANLARTGLNFFQNNDDLKYYKSLIDTDGSGIIGYLDINIIGCHLPIYHGVDDTVLQIAIGHIPGTSLPVGGESTHCVLSGHRGLPSAKIFSNLNRLSEGDTFVIHTLSETLTYEVDSILTVLPEDISTLRIEPGADLCTLVTCTPYGVNTHRLLVRGHRTDNAFSSTANVSSEALVIKGLLSVAVFALPIAIIGLTALFVMTNINEKRSAVRRKLGLTELRRRHL